MKDRVQQHDVETIVRVQTADRRFIELTEDTIKNSMEIQSASYTGSIKRERIGKINQDVLLRWRIKSRC